MGQVLHGSATTTAAVGRAIQHSQESLRALAKRLGINPKTVAKWRKRASASDLPTGPKEPRSTVLSVEEEAVVVAFRRHTLLPLDDCLYALQPTIPHLTRSSLHRCLKRHGISRLPQVEGEASPKRKFKAYPIGYFHIDIAEVRTAQGRLYLIVAIDRTSKFAFVELHEKVTRRTAADFLRRLTEAVPYRVHTVLTDNGTHFTDPAGETRSPAEIKEMIAQRRLFHAHAFEYACALNDVDHRLTKPKHPWTNGQVERMNRTIKDATVKRYFYETHDELRAHLRDFVDAYNFPRRLKTLRGLTPYEFICKAWTSQPQRFTISPLQKMTGLNPVQPGDTIMLMSGNYGDITLGNFNLPTTNSDFVTVAAAPGQVPAFSTLFIDRTNKWVFNSIKVQSFLGTNNNKRALVTVTDQGAAFPTSDIILENMEISSADNTDGWTQAEWVARVRAIGIFAKGNDHGADTSCVSVTNSHISKIVFGSEVMANNMLFSGNEIDRFGDDGIDYVASNLLISKNYIHDDLDLGNGAHIDGMQGYPGGSSNVVIDSNRVIRQTDPKLPFPNYLQGIDAFDGDWTNLTVTNNVVVSSCWGIFYGSVHGGKIINNTVVRDGLMPMPGNCKPIVLVGDKTHQGSSSNDVIIRNNIAPGLSIYNLDPNMTLDHNICLGTNGRCQIVTYVNGKLDWNTINPGIHGDHNIIDGRGAGGMFVSFDPAKFVYDLRLKSGAIAIGAGNSAEAPPIDITGAPRRSPVDVGAYQYAPLK